MFIIRVRPIFLVFYMRAFLIALHKVFNLIDSEIEQLIFIIKCLVLPVVPRKAVAEVSEIGNL